MGCFQKLFISIVHGVHGKNSRIGSRLFAGYRFVHPDSFHYNYRYIYLHSFFCRERKNLVRRPVSIPVCIVWRCIIFFRAPVNGVRIIFYLIKMKLKKTMSIKFMKHDIQISKLFLAALFVFNGRLNSSIA